MERKLRADEQESDTGLIQSLITTCKLFVQRDFSEEFRRTYALDMGSVAETAVRDAPWLEVAVPIKLCLEAETSA